MKACKVEDGVLEIDEEICNHCGRCVGKCRFDAIEDGTQGYKIYIGGRWGKKVKQGRALKKIFTSKEEVLDVVEKAILLFREQLMGSELLERKQEILDAKLHLTGGASC